MQQSGGPSVCLCYSLRWKVNDPTFQHSCLVSSRSTHDSFYMLTSKSLFLLLRGSYRIYLCISRPFTTKKSAQKIALDLSTSHTQRPDQRVREISITTAWSALGKPIIIVVDFHQFLAHSSSTRKCEIINAKWFKCRSTGDYFYCVFWSV